MSTERDDEARAIRSLANAIGALTGSPGDPGDRWSLSEAIGVSSDSGLTGAINRLAGAMESLAEALDAVLCVAKKAP